MRKTQCTTPTMLLFFLFLPQFLLLNVNAQSDWKYSIEEIILKSTTLILEDYPTDEASCFFRPFNSPIDYFITCPTNVTCNFKKYNKQYGSIKDLCEPCESLRDNNLLPVDQQNKLTSVFQTLTLANDTSCDDEFRSLGTFQAYAIDGINLGQLGGSPCPENNEDDAIECQYQLDSLFVLFSKIEFLPNNAFCQFRNLEVLLLNNCQLCSIEEDSFVHLLKLQQLWLSSNEITHLPENLFRNNANLQYLDLRDNRLQLPALKAFVGLGSLKFLMLEKTSLTSLNDSIAFPTNLKMLSIAHNRNLTEVDENVFRNSTLMANIVLSGNRIKQLGASTFENNLKLETIDLSSNKLREFPPIGHLCHLRVLNLRFNKISSIKRSHLFNCSRLTSLILSRNRLSSVEQGSFDNFSQLEELYLSYNRLSEKSCQFKISSKIFKLYLDHNRFVSFSFKDFPRGVSHLSIANNQIRSITAFNFSTLERWNLTSLDFSYNQLISIEHLQLPLSIQSIDFSFNHISKIISYSDIVEQKLHQLRSINLKSNNITILCRNLFEGDGLRNGLSRTIEYYLSSNPLKCTCDNSWIKYIRSNNWIKIADRDKMYCHEKQPYESAINGSVQLIKISAHRFPCQPDYTNSTHRQCPVSWSKLSCPYNCTCTSDSHFKNIHLRCNNKQLQHIPTLSVHKSAFYNSNITFNLSMNAIPCISPFNLGEINVQIITLILSHSKINSVEIKAFDRLIGLVRLDLSHNQLSTLPKELFHNLQQLVHLNLSHNHLMHLTDDIFNSLSNLQSLYLHSNSLHELNLKPIIDLKSLSNITLHDNPWFCECTFIKSFRANLVDHSTPVYNKLELKCKEQDTGTYVNIANFNDDHCTTQIHLTIIIVSLTIGLVLLVAIGLVFKWRFELQVLVYSRYGLRTFHRAEEEVESKQYDAFVAYNSEDSEFLVNELLPGLEGIAKPYRLCIHQRDFPAGSYINNSILDAIDMSSRTIVLLSESFASSGWCRFEFKSAHMKMLQDKCPRILVILVGEVPENLDPEMMLYLKTNTYVKWGEKLFWQKLYYAMPDKRVTLPATAIMPMRRM